MSKSPNLVFSNPQSPTISSPPPKRLTFLLSTCQNLQKNVSRTCQGLTKSSSEKLNSLTKLRSIFNKDLNENFMQIYKSNKQVVKPTSSSPVSTIRSKIETLISPRREKHKFTLKRREGKDLEELRKEYVESEEICNNEAQEYLKMNKRKFGEMFEQRPNPVIANNQAAGSKPPLIPYKSRYSFRTKEKELMENYYEEKKNLADKMKIEKLIHRKQFL